MEGNARHQSRHRACVPPGAPARGWSRDGRGSVVVVGSRAVERPWTSASASAYGTTKAAVVALAQTVAAEVLEHGVRVNAILPSTLDTAANRRAMPEADSSRWVTTESAAGVIAFLLSDEARDVSGAAAISGLTDGPDAGEAPHVPAVSRAPGSRAATVRRDESIRPLRSPARRRGRCRPHRLQHGPSDAARSDRRRPPYPDLTQFAASCDASAVATGLTRWVRRRADDQRGRDRRVIDVPCREFPLGCGVQFFTGDHAGGCLHSPSCACVTPAVDNGEDAGDSGPPVAAPGAWSCKR